MTIRTIRFINDRLTLTVTDDFHTIVRTYDPAPPLGEELDRFLDTGIDLG